MVVEAETLLLAGPLILAWEAMVAEVVLATAAVAAEATAVEEAAAPAAVTATRSPVSMRVEGAEEAVPISLTH
jgi:hypothetical protein